MGQSEAGVVSSDRVRLGISTQSSNTMVEPLTAVMAPGLPETSTHFIRFPMFEVSLSDAALAQFDTFRVTSTVRLWADARGGVITWNSTGLEGLSVGWATLPLDYRGDRHPANLIKGA